MNFRLSVPITYRNDNSSCPPWYTKEPRYLKNRGNRLYKKFKTSGSSSDYMNYSIVTHKCDTLNWKFYDLYFFKMKTRLKSGTKVFFNVVNSKRKVTGFLASLNCMGTSKSSDHAIADLFADIFRSTYSQLNSSDYFLI